MVKAMSSLVCFWLAVPMNLVSCVENSETKILSDSMSEESQGSIGVAFMENDGTLVLTLRAISPDAVGDGVLVYEPRHKSYDEVIRHLGGIKKGEEKSVPPWP